MLSSLFLLPLLVALSCCREGVIDLNGDEWSVTRDGEHKYRARVPGQIHTDLI